MIGLVKINIPGHRNLCKCNNTTVVVVGRDVGELLVRGKRGGVLESVGGKIKDRDT